VPASASNKHRKKQDAPPSQAEPTGIVRCWYVYIIQAASGRLYTGITTDIARRWQQHSSGQAGAKFFRGDKPDLLRLVEQSADRSSASKREATIKRLTRQQKQLLINTQGPCPI